MSFIIALFTLMCFNSFLLYLHCVLNLGHACISLLLFLYSSSSGLKDRDAKSLGQRQNNVWESS